MVLVAGVRRHRAPRAQAIAGLRGAYADRGHHALVFVPEDVAVVDEGPALDALANAAFAMGLDGKEWIQAHPELGVLSIGLDGTCGRPPVSPASWCEPSRHDTCKVPLPQANTRETRTAAEA